ncbi:Senescence/dehydration-associated protein At4g35985, chloroplastic [Linum perenne]
MVMKIPGCCAFLMVEGEAIELAYGEFRISRVVDKSAGGIPVATVVKVGKELQWPLTREEPVVKLDNFHYLFSLPMKNVYSLSYGLTFPTNQGKILGTLDSFLAQNSCFSGTNINNNKNNSSISSSSNLDWKQIAQGTIQIVRGIFMCSNVYSNLVKCAEMILNGGGEVNSIKKTAATQNGTQKGLKR